MLHRDKLRQQPLLLLLIPVCINHPATHIMNRYESRRRNASFRQRLENKRRVEAPKAGAADVIARVNGGEPQFGGLFYDVYGEVLFFVPFGRFRRQFIRGETCCGFADRFLVVAKGKVHMSVRLDLGDAAAARKRCRAGGARF